MKSPLTFTGSKFLQLYFNQLYSARLALQSSHINVAHGTPSVVDEAVRTIRISAVIIEKNERMKQIFDSTIKQALLEKLETLSDIDIDAIMTLIPEA